MVVSTIGAIARLFVTGEFFRQGPLQPFAGAFQQRRRFGITADFDGLARGLHHQAAVFSRRRRILPCNFLPVWYETRRRLAYNCRALFDGAGCSGNDSRDGPAAVNDVDDPREFISCQEGKEEP